MTCSSDNEGRYSPGESQQGIFESSSTNRQYGKAVCLSCILPYVGGYPR